MHPLYPHERDDIVAVLRIKIQQDGLLDDHDSAALSRELLERNNWDLVQATHEYEVRGTPATPPIFFCSLKKGPLGGSGVPVYAYRTPPVGCTVKKNGGRSHVFF